MARKKKKSILSTFLTIVVIAAIAWMKYQETIEANESDSGSGNYTDTSHSDASVPSPELTEVGDSSHSSGVASQLTTVSLSSSKFEILENCTLKDHYGNDGDSFHVTTPKGDHELRLYYVDAPESSARKYRDGNTNYERIAQQGAAMGGLSQEETTQIGMAAKSFVKKLLTGKTFRVATVWESVYNSRRSYAYILVPYEGQERYLHELLVAHGLGRIHTKPYMLPDSTASSRHKKHLYQVEKYAQKMRYGAWGL
ncbi:MAG: thermonuclease family protein [Akkermansiaceae bacterium]